MKLSVPTPVPLPCQPQLARCVKPGALPGAGSSQSTQVELRQGDVVNVTNRMPDGSLVYAVKCSDRNSVLGEGWLHSDHVQVEPGLSTQARLSTNQLLQRTAFGVAKEEFLNPDFPATLALREGEVMQLSIEKNGWAFGWPLENPGRRGWFPTGMLEKLDRPISLSALKKRGEQELSVSASAALVQLLKANPPPPPLQWAWEGELPPAIAESAQLEEHRFREQLEHMEAVAEAELQASADAAEPGAASGVPAGGAGGTDEPQGAAEDSFVLMVCIAKFTPSAEGLLQLKVGDLVRVTSHMDAEMLFGFREKSSSSAGWFPKNNVKLLEDPLSQAEDVPVRAGPPKLPTVPASLLARRKQK